MRSPQFSNCVHYYYCGDLKLKVDTDICPFKINGQRVSEIVSECACESKRWKMSLSDIIVFFERFR